MTNFLATAITTPTSLNNTLSIETDIYLGRNQIRRNVGHNVAVYMGATTNDQLMDITPLVDYTATFQTPTQVLVLRVSAPVTVTVTIGGITRVLPVNRVLVLDSPVTALTIHNGGSVVAQAQLSYAS